MKINILTKLNITLKCFLRFFFFALNCTISSQTLYPEITNYSFGSSQNWSLDVCDDQSIAVANNSGLSIFNGQSWLMHQLPKNMIIRSVFCHNDVIYTGSYEEFGYWEKNESGLLKYHSLKRKFDEKSPKQSEEFWEIIRYGESIFFRSFGAIYKYDGKIITTVTDSFNVSSLTIYKDKLLFGSFSDGLFEIVGNEVKPFSDLKPLAGLKSVNLLSIYQDFLFAYDTNSGAYLFKDNELLKLPASLNIIFKNYTLNKVEFIDSKTIAFGTVKNGIVIYKIKSKNFKIINRQSGIRNNTVLDIEYKNGFLWLALDNGISRIDINSEYNYYNDNSGVLGTVYDVAFFKGKYYLASNTGVYTFTNNQLKLIENSEGHCWEILKYQNKLLFGHNRGAFILNEEKLIPISGSFSGVYDYISIPESKNLLVSTYSGIGVLINNKSKFLISKLSGIDVPVDKLIFENDSTLWATDNYKGLFKINFDATKLEVKNVIRLNNKKIVDADNVEFHTINNKLYFKIDDNWFTYSDSSQSFKPFLGLKNQKFLSNEGESFWMLDKVNSSIINYDEKFKIVKKLNNKNLTSKFVNDYEKILFKNDSIRIFNLKDGFATLNFNKVKPKNQIKPVIDKIYVNNKLLNSHSPKNEIKLNHAQAKSISFDVYSPGNYDKELEYDLQGELSQRENILDGNFKLQNLPTGDYILSIYEKGNALSITKLQLKILPPWTLSIWMKILYLLLLLTTIYLIGKFQEKKAERTHLKAQERLVEEANKKIELVEKDNLINEVNSRKKELTNRTATIVKKNEAIILLRNELRRLEKTSPNITRTKNILRRSGEQLDSKNDWYLFESKFNELNEDFFNKLSKEFPKLTTKDRKLCAYIKIGLTSKEIAPLLDITLRSVELQRYRLRKKLNLGANITFNEFLRHF